MADAGWALLAAAAAADHHQQACRTCFNAAAVHTKSMLALFSRVQQLLCYL
jgi:hypothetical protein